MKSNIQVSYSEGASYLLALFCLGLVLKVGLLLALFSGLLQYALVRLLVPTIERRLSTRKARLIAVGFLSSLIILALAATIWGVVIFLKSEAGNTQNLLQKLADVIEASRSQLPLWLTSNLPADVDGLKRILLDTLHEHAAEAKSFGQEAGHALVHILLGVIIGSMLALQDVGATLNDKPLAQALRARVMNLAEIFHRVVFAQVRISLINTTLTAIFLAIVLPIWGIHLPLLKTTIAITFVVGLIPVVGNIISNTVIVMVSLSNSLQVAIIALVYMVLIHKLEYFLNARIIGSQVNARPWELLTAILVMETLFGVPGVVAAPVFYSYVKRELKLKEWI